jgi:hypothetical protein
LAADFSLCGYLKAKVYETHPSNIPDLKHHIWEHFEAILSVLLQCVMVCQFERKSAGMVLEDTCKMSFSNADD